MIRIILAIVIGLILGLLSAYGGTLYGMAKSNMVGAKNGIASDFMKSDVIFYEKRDERRR